MSSIYSIYSISCKYAISKTVKNSEGLDQGLNIIEMYLYEDIAAVAENVGEFESVYDPCNILFMSQMKVEAEPILDDDGVGQCFLLLFHLLTIHS